MIANQENLGYPAANNMGLRALGDWGWNGNEAGSAPARYALLLNADTELPATALVEMIAFMDANPEAGAAGPKLVLPDGRLDLACRRSFPSPEVIAYRITFLSKLFPRSRRFGRYNLTYLSPDVNTEVDSVVGAFMYFATLTEVPILQGLLGAGMGKGPALALLLAGPALSLPNMLVIRSVMGTKKTVAFVSLVVVMATISGMIFGHFFA